MEEVDLVIVGAEGVAESGGIINKVDPFNNHLRILYKQFVCTADRDLPDGSDG